MPEEAISKVIFGGETLMDLTSDTVDAQSLLRGYTAHGKDGLPIDGECDFDVDSSDATMGQAEILSGKTGYARGTKLTGTMPNNGGVNLKITAVDQQLSIPIGFHDGSGKTQIDAAEQAKITANNIREGVTILGVEGSMSGTEGVKAQSKTITPSKDSQTVLPDSEYNYLSQVVVEGIPVTRSANSAGGITVTIG